MRADREQHIREQVNVGVGMDVGDAYDCLVEIDRLRAELAKAEREREELHAALTEMTRAVLRDDDELADQLRRMGECCIADELEPIAAVDALKAAREEGRAEMLTELRGLLSIDDQLAAYGYLDALKAGGK